MLRLVSHHFSLQKSWFAPGAVRVGLLAVRVSLEKGLLWVIWGLPLSSLSINALYSLVIGGMGNGSISACSSTEIYSLPTPRMKSSLQSSMLFRLLCVKSYLMCLNRNRVITHLAETDAEAKRRQQA
jgi:hypothetical protein